VFLLVEEHKGTWICSPTIYIHKIQSMKSRNLPTLVMRVGLLISLAALSPERNLAAQQVPVQTSPPSSSTEPGVTVLENISYASINGSALKLDIYEPSGNGSVLRPAVVLIHGGGWTSFDKSTMA
jgi:acetyl esterase/lipase